MFTVDVKQQNNKTTFLSNKKPLGAPNQSYYIETIFGKLADFANTLTKPVSPYVAMYLVKVSTVMVA